MPSRQEQKIGAHSHCIHYVQAGDKSDSKWLHDAGYSGMPQFANSYGLKLPDDIDQAKELINMFRKDDQKKWKADNADTKKQKTDPKLIEAAMAWHLKLGHANYHAVKHAPNAINGMGVDFSKLNVKDMPPCSTCAMVGLDPFNENT
ncbi:hypothetical protein GMOD_00005473 [Pyrenophora seminiperda CCB06]|uniref:Uncharacterized protein n=1 Tax=Pyrenophora seminiperda CCB06 TaxID=1302712 RepID=A0A3M7LVT3_9PLEO|nr:hypothetical protein GMOD_00005473 [Pyrenophora seminiperda CCB06]